MKQTGYVTEVTEEKGDIKIKVRVIRGSACGGHCASCKGCPAEVQTVICDGYDGAKKGDRVELSSEGRQVVGGAALGYCIPAACGILGSIGGYCIFKTDIGAVIFAALGIAAGIFIVKLFAARYKIKITAVKKAIDVKKTIDTKKQN